MEVTIFDKNMECLRRVCYNTKIWDKILQIRRNGGALT